MNTTSGVETTFASVDEMLSPETLATIIRRPVTYVHREPFTPAGWSSTGATFEVVHIDGRGGPDLIAKTVVRDRDWVAIATGDGVDREVRTWESGLLGRLPEPAAHAVLAGARSDAGYTILMPDLSDHLLPDGPENSFPLPQQGLVVEALAAVHAEFWMDESLLEPSLGLSTLSVFIGHLAPSTMERVRARIGPTELTEWIAEGWDKLRSVADPQVAASLEAIAEDPTLLVEALSRFPWTLAHTDPRPDNLAIDAARQRVYFLDWTRPATAPPAIDLLYWLFTANNAHAAPRHEVVDAYTAALARRIGSRFPLDWWVPQLDLCFVAFVACFIPVIVNVNPAAAAQWTERCRPGLRALG